MPASCRQISKAGAFENLSTKIIEYCQDFVIARDKLKTAVFHSMIQKVFDEPINRRLLAWEIQR